MRTLIASQPSEKASWFTLAYIDQRRLPGPDYGHDLFSIHLAPSLDWPVPVGVAIIWFITAWFLITNPKE